MKVGILGGSFNPPHPGHIHISKLAMEKLALNQVWWVPALQNPLKEDQSKSYQNRLELCEKALKKEPKFKIHKSEEVYSHKLVENLKKKYPKIEFIWVMGSDNLEQLHKWQNYKSFIASIKLAIFSRENSLITVKKTPVWNLLKKEDPQIFLTKNLDISSTQIREENNE
jgi:nicotinate-nucleotide adenylyltransferase